MLVQASPFLLRCMALGAALSLSFVASTAVGQEAVEPLTFFDASDAFVASCPNPDMVVEDFDDTLVPLNSIGACPATIDSSTGGDCYEPGALAPGFSLTTLSGTMVQVITPSIIGVTSAVVTPNEVSEILFSGDDVTGFGLDLLTGEGMRGGVLEIEVFGAGDVMLGAFSAPFTPPPGQFFAVQSDESIERVVMLWGNGLLIDNLEFGPCLGDGTLPPDVVDVPGVGIDIKPGMAENAVDPMSRGLIPVAILGSETFDVETVDTKTLAFGPEGAPPMRLFRRFHRRARDLNDDGYRDLLSVYRTEKSGIALGDTEACLSGETLDGTAFEGCDDIVTDDGCGRGYGLAFVVPPLLWLRRRRRAARE